jgi:hypothetical protein
MTGLTFFATGLYFFLAAKMATGREVISAFDLEVEGDETSCTKEGK